MPRARRAKASACAAHGTRCSLAGGSRYTSDRCEPAADLTPQEETLAALLRDGLRDGRGWGGGPTAVRRSLVVIDADHAAMLAAVEADNAEREAVILAGGVVES